MTFKGILNRIFGSFILVSLLVIICSELTQDNRSSNTSSHKVTSVPDDGRQPDREKWILQMKEAEIIAKIEYDSQGIYIRVGRKFMELSYDRKLSAAEIVTTHHNISHRTNLPAYLDDYYSAKRIGKFTYKNSLSLW